MSMWQQTCKVSRVRDREQENVERQATSSRRRDRETDQEGKTEDAKKTGKEKVRVLRDIGVCDEVRVDRMGSIGYWHRIHNVVANSAFASQTTSDRLV